MGTVICFLMVQKKLRKKSKCNLGHIESKKNIYIKNYIFLGIKQPAYLSSELILDTKL